MLIKDVSHWKTFFFNKSLVVLYANLTVPEFIKVDSKKVGTYKKRQKG
jgi:hypothetical protein